jgi:hypothetical protein
VVGSYLTVELLGRTQKQRNDDLYYTCIQYVALRGTPICTYYHSPPLHPFSPYLPLSSTLYRSNAFRFLLSLVLSSPSPTLFCYSSGNFAPIRNQQSQEWELEYRMVGGSILSFVDEKLEEEKAAKEKRDQKLRFYVRFLRSPEILAQLDRLPDPDVVQQEVEQLFLANHHLEGPGEVGAGAGAVGAGAGAVAAGAMAAVVDEEELMLDEEDEEEDEDLILAFQAGYSDDSDDEDDSATITD